MPEIDRVAYTRRSPWTYLALGIAALLVIVLIGSTLRSQPQTVGTLALQSNVDESVVFTEALRVSEDDGAAVAGAFDLEVRRERDDVAKATAPDRIDDALIVRSASLELEVADVAEVLPLARAEIGGLGGYVAGSDEYDQGDRRWASVTYRVPVDRFGEAIEAVRGLSDRVVRESTQSQEVTATIVDLDARIANLRASESALVEIMDRSGRMEDVLAVQMRLEEVRGQIERLEAQRASLADQAARSTLSVSWFTPLAAVTVAQEAWSLEAELDAALAQTVEGLQGMARVGVWLAVVALPLLGIPLLVVAVLALWLRRRRPGEDTSLTPTPAE